MSEGVDGGFLRPFVITGGRTEVHRSDLHLDTLVSALPGRSVSDRGFEHRAVLQQCASPMSIAEIATALDLPVGVVTVVVDDLLEASVLVVHERQPSAVPLSILERLVEGVRAL
jgi:Protein of unknown function (DUF742)